MDVSSASERELGKIKDLESQRSLLNIQLLAIDQLKDQITKEKDNVNLNLNLEGTSILCLRALITNLNNLIG